MGINKVIITGNLTSDAELRTTQSGAVVLQMGVAVDERRRNAQTGEWESVPCFVDCAMFGPRAERLAPHLAKGCRVAVEGKLRWSQWERDGQRRTKLDVVIDEVVFLSARAECREDSGQEPAPIAPGDGAPRFSHHTEYGY